MKQTEALEILKTGKNVFLTGPAGSGKTFLLNKYIDFLKSRSIPVGVTASTGIAATHMNGVTIHSWSGLGIKDSLSSVDINNLLEKPYLKKRFKNARVLVIDEISMLHAFQLDALDMICRAFKKNDLPFGGMQIILCGDFFQLPPINKENQEKSFIYKAIVWNNMNLQICYLEEQYRQNEEDSLLEILNEIRDNRVSQETLNLLAEKQKEKQDLNFIPTKLYTHNRDVDTLNFAELDKIDSHLAVYRMKDSGTKKLVEILQKSCLAHQELRLKKGASVMFIKNNFEKGYVNGTLGTVVDFGRGKPIVQTFSGREILVEEENWHIEEEGKQKAKITQLPLRLAWAITVHKSQGMSLDSAEIDLSKSFVAGMGYVALSRVRSLEGLFLKGLNNTALSVDEEILSFDKDLKKESERAVLRLEQEKNLKELQDEFLGNSEVVYSEEEEKISTYDITKEMLKQEMLLEDIARERNLTYSTIVNHLEKIAQEKGSAMVDFSYIKNDIEDFDKITEAWKKTKGDKLTPVKKLLPEHVSWEDIRLVKLFL